MDQPIRAALPAAEYHSHTQNHHDQALEEHQADEMSAGGQAAADLVVAAEGRSPVVRIDLGVVADAIVAHIDFERTALGLEGVKLD